MARMIIAGRWERWFWKGLMTLPMAVVTLGLVSLSAFRKATTADKQGIVRLEYNRLDRFAAPTSLRVRLAANVARKRRLQLFINYGYLNAVRLRRIFPSPEGIEPRQDGVIFTFRVDEPAKPMDIVFQVEGIAYGQLDGEVALAGAGRLPFTQYLLP